MAAKATNKKRRRLGAAERRAKILDSALEVFAEHGYEGASMAEIAKRAGVVASVIYDHVPSKRDLYVELLRTQMTALIARSVRDFPSEGPPREVLRMAMEGHYSFVEENPFAWRFLFRDPPAKPQIVAAHKEVRGWATDAVAALIEAVTTNAGVQVPAAERHQIAQIIAAGSRGAVDGLAAWWYDHRRVPRSEMVEMAVRILYQGLGGILQEELARGSAPVAESSMPQHRSRARVPVA